MKIFYVGPHYEVIDGKKYPTFWHTNFYESLRELPNVQVVVEPGEGIPEPLTPEAREKLTRRITEEKPDVFLIVVSHGFDKVFVRELTRRLDVATVGIFVDDDGGYFDSYQHWSGCFDWSVTFYPPAVRWREARGDNCVGINWACRPGGLYEPRREEKGMDISFIGAGGPQRKEFVKRLERRIGRRVTCFGKGWNGGLISPEEMALIFARTEVNINITGQPMNPFLRPRSLAKLFFRRHPEKLAYLFDPRALPQNIQTYRNLMYPMSRARPFEVLASGNFIITDRARYFGSPFIEGKEIVSYASLSDLAEKIEYYLPREAERAAIARAGHARVLREHTFRRRIEFMLKEIFAGDPKRRRKDGRGEAITQYA